MVAEGFTWRDQSGRSLTLSGQVNPAFNVVDDGISTDVFIVDNDTSNTRFRLDVDAPLGETSLGGTIEIGKNAAGNDAAFAFKTGFSARALIGLLGSDDFSFKVSPDGSAYFDAILIDRTSGRVELPKPAILPAASSAPAAPASGKLALYARTRAGQPWLDAMRPNGRDFSLQPHLGLARTANWLPSSGATITTEGMSNSDGRHRLDAGPRGDLARDQHAPLAADLGGDGGLGVGPAQRRLHLLARQRRRARRLDLRDPHLARHPAGDRHGVLRPLRLDRGARHHADLERRRQLHRHRLPARHPHPLAARHATTRAARRRSSTWARASPSPPAAC